MAKAKHNWANIRHQYITGQNDVTLEYLSNQPDAPALTTLKKRSARENWSKEREIYRHQVSTKLRQKATVSEAEVAAQQLQDARLMRAKALASLERFTEIDLDPKEARMYLKEAAEIERKALGMDTIQVKIDKRLDELSDEELERLLKEHKLLEETL